MRESVGENEMYYWRIRARGLQNCFHPHLCSAEQFPYSFLTNNNMLEEGEVERATTRVRGGRDREGREEGGTRQQEGDKESEEGGRKRGERVTGERRERGRNRER